MHYRYLRQKASASRKKDFREAEEAVLQVVEFEDGALGAGGGDLAVKAQPALLELGPVSYTHLTLPTTTVV